MISMNGIPGNLRVPGPYIGIDNTKAFRGLSGMPTKVLVIGQKLAAGTAVVNTPYLVTSPDQANLLFGAGSQLANMMERFKGANTFIEVWAIAQIDNAAGAAATATVTFAGTATAAGTQSLWIGGRRVQIAVTVGMTAAQAATALAAAIAAATDLPVTGAAGAAIVTLTARHKGECANTINLRANYYSDELTPAGLTITPTVFTGGTGNPDVTAVLTAIGDEWYTDMVMPYLDTANMNLMEAELNLRYGPLKQVDGHLYNGRSDTHANLITAGQARNNPHVSTLGLYRSPTPSYEIAAVLAAVCSFNLQIDPARPVQTLALPGILAPDIVDRFTLEERNLLLLNGISTVRIGVDGMVYIERVVTNYRLNPFGAADPSYLDIETMKTVAYLRYDLRNFITLQYPRYKLADDGTNFARGQAVVTPSVIRASIISRFKLWEENGLVENIDQFKEELIVERNTNDPNRLDALIPPDIINGFRIFAANLQFVL